MLEYNICSSPVATLSWGKLADSGLSPLQLPIWKSQDAKSSLFFSFPSSALFSFFNYLNKRKRSTTNLGVVEAGPKSKLMPRLVFFSVRVCYHRREATLFHRQLWQRLSPSVSCWEHHGARCSVGNEVTRVALLTATSRQLPPTVSYTHTQLKKWDS